MISYADLMPLKKDKLLAKLTPLDAASLNELLKRHPNLPQDYIQFLEQFGCGVIGDEAYMLYCGPSRPDDIYGLDTQISNNILLLGDDFSGYCNGFSVEDWSLIEIDPTDMKPERYADSFSEFIRKKIAHAKK